MPSEQQDRGMTKKPTRAALLDEAASNLREARADLHAWSIAQACVNGAHRAAERTVQAAEERLKALAVDEVPDPNPDFPL